MFRPLQGLPFTSVYIFTYENVYTMYNSESKSHIFVYILLIFEVLFLLLHEHSDGS